MLKKNIYKKIIDLTIIISLFPIINKVLKPNIGLDLTDEGLYLLAANPSNKFDSFGWPFGWNTGILFRVIDYDISEFRRISAFLLLVITYVFSKTFITRINNVKNDKSYEKTFEFLIPFATTLSALLFYVGLLRTPGYNWLNAIGIMTSIIGYNIYVSVANSRSKQMCGTFLVALGLISSLPAKPSSPIFIVAITTILIKMFHPRLNPGKYLFEIILNTSLITGFLLILKIWPTDFVSRFLAILSSPTMGENSTILGALKQVLLTPVIIPYNVVRNINSFQIVLAILFILILIVRRIKRNQFRIFTILELLILSLFVFNFNDINLSPQGIVIANYSRMDSPQIAISFFLILFYILFRSAKYSSSESSHKNKVEVYILLITAPLIFAFGTTAAVIGKISPVVFFVILLTYLQILRIDNNEKIRKLLLVSVLVLNFTLVAILLSPRINVPYRMKPFENQKTEISIVGKNSTLYLDSEAVFAYNDIKKTLQKNSYSKSTKLIDLSLPWQPGLIYLLDASNPQSLILTIPGAPGSEERFEDSLRKSTNKSDYKNGWLLINKRAETSVENYTLARLLLIYQKYSRLSFPDDYNQIYISESREIWKPKLEN